MNPAANLLSRPPEEGARLVALSFLDQAAAALPRLEDPDDREALHDLRVGLRRLRSTLRSYSPWLKDSLPKKLRRRLRNLARSTGPGRDTEVQMDWLRGRAPHLSRYHRTGLIWLLDRLEARMREANEDLLERLPRELPEIEADLRERLSTYRMEVHLTSAAGPLPTLGDVTGAILRRQVAELESHLARVGGPEDETEAHRARISAKRLRYLIEPFVEELPAAAAVVKRLKSLQDLLGDLHDAHVLEQELAAAIEEAATERARRILELSLADPPDKALLRTERRRSRASGLIALAGLNHARRNHLFEELQEQWLAGRSDGLLREAETLFAQLTA